MQIVNITDNNKVKCEALERAGIIVSKYPCGEYNKYIVSIKGFPNADRFFETRFDSIPDICRAFKDRLLESNYKLVA